MEFKRPTLEPIVSEDNNIFTQLDNEWGHIQKKRFYVTHSLDGATGQTAANFGVIFNAPFDCYVSEVRVSWSTACDTNTTLNIERLQGTEALDAGDTILAANLDLTGTANTVNTPTLTTTIPNRSLKRGDRLALKDGGGGTALVGLCVTIELIYN